MNGGQDMGGTHGFGPVVVEKDEAVFQADWERRIFGTQICTRLRGIDTLDEVREGLESMSPAQYLSASYYEKWILALERLLVEKQVLTEDELLARYSEFAANPSADLPSHPEPSFVEFADRVVRTGGSASREVVKPPSFRAGDIVITRNVHPCRHTRMPRYVRGRRGVIERVYDAFLLPDLNVTGVEQPEYVYAVALEGRELWGESAEARSRVYIDLWESYLLPGEEAA
ncbi:MAG: nitrile hydratase subunit beta [Thermoleophilia bacterium]|nr:nitrile hydratase subunit beta [Thermoleophilia bacterium]